MLAGASIVFFAFIGFDIVATTAEETKNPQRDVSARHPRLAGDRHRALRRGGRGALRHGELHRAARAGEKANLATAFTANGIDWAAKVISIGALAGLTTVVIVLVLGQTRVLFAMSRDGLLPRSLAKTGKHGTPVRITLIVGALVAVTASVFPIDKLEEMVNIGTLFAFVLVSAGVIVLRRTRPDLHARIPGAVCAIAADRGDHCVRVADAQPHRADLDPIPHLDGHRRGDLLRLRPPALGARPAGSRCNQR